LLENAREQEAIACIERWRAEGKSLRVIAELLEQHGFKPKRSRARRHSTVIRILARPA
jgi:DNA-binding transcriptional MerR regulator